MILKPSTEAELFAWPNGKRAAVSLSFDDGRPSQLDRGMPILDGCGARATFYVSLENVRRRVGDWARAAERGHEIGNHSMTHPCSGNFAFSRGKALEEYTLPRIEGDLLQASEAIREALGTTPVTYAYPCGQTFVGRGKECRSYVPVVARHFLVGRGAFDETCNDPAFCDLAQAMSRDGDACSLAELRAMVDQAVEAGGWLILMGHDVGEAGLRQVTVATALEALCRHMLDAGSGIWLDTVAAVGRYVQERRQTLQANP